MATSDLRKSILQYAMQGKLVKQDPNDEPASVLLEKIKQEKEKLIKEGKVKRDKNESIIYRGDDNHYYEKIGNKVTDITDEIPFEIPESWILVRQYVVCWLDNGVQKSNKVLPYLEAKTIRGLQEAKLISSGIILEKGQKVILVDGENSGEVMDVPLEGYMGSTFKILGKTSFINYDYLSYFFLQNKDLYKNNKKGAAIPHLNKDIFRNLLFPLPPLAEQQRIVDKLEELEPYISEYERLVEENEQLDKGFPEKLKQSILQYAMQGKLVKQDPNDEPASVLLEKIKQEKEKLIKEGKVKKDKNESIIYRGDDKNYYEKIGNINADITEDIPFEIPEDWAWTRMRSLCLDIFFGRTPIYSKTKNENIIIGQAANDGEKIDFNYAKYGESSFWNKMDEKYFLKYGDVLLNSLGHGTLGRCGINLTSLRMLTDGHLIIFRAEHLITSMYIYLYLTLMRGSVEKSAVGTTNQTFLKLSSVENYMIPLPPLAEQKRIVNKIESIFSLL